MLLLKENITSPTRILRRLSPEHYLALSFVLLIGIGTFLLSLPWSVHGERLTFIDSLFTATSASCVTGLIVVDTGSKFTFFGQIVILVLIQLGGLGIMTFTTLFAYLMTGKLTIREHAFAEASLGSQPFLNVGKLLFYIVSGTFIFELIGTIFLTFRFLQQFAFGKALFLGVFHSISAFCNAGFSLFSHNLMDYKKDIIVNSAVMILIIAGGLGFWVFVDLFNIPRSKRGFRALSLHSKIVLAATGFLIAGGMVGILVFEWSNALRDLSLGQKIMAAAFQSVTPRTAGFNTLEISRMTNSTIFLILLLMMIGASPGSCGGGIKTTTAGLLVAMIMSRLRDIKQVRLFNRGISESIVSKAIGIAFFWFLAVGITSMILLYTEHSGRPHAEERILFPQVIFESFSAIGTVGLSMGLTPVLSTFGKVLIIILMYIGRIGPVTLALAITRKPFTRYSLAEGKVFVG